MCSKDNTGKMKGQLIGWKKLIFKSCISWGLCIQIYKRVWMWKLDHKESWVLKNWCFWTMVLEKTLESLLDCKIKQFNTKGNQSWIFIGRSDAEAETLTLRPPDARTWLIWKDAEAGKKLKAGGEGDNGRWDDWVASPSR